MFLKKLSSGLEDVIVYGKAFPCYMWLQAAY